MSIQTTKGALVTIKPQMGFDLSKVNTLRKLNNYKLIADDHATGKGRQLLYYFSVHPLSVV